MTKISIVMTTYNGAPYIKKQMESIKSQLLQPDEVVILDDNSSDNTVQIIKEFISKYNLQNWHLFKNSRNIGYKQNFLNGLKLAIGDYIFLCDQDDEWKPEKIKRMIEIMQYNPNISALNCGVQLIDANSNHLYERYSKNYKNSGFMYFRQKIDKLTYFSFSYIAKHNISPGCTMAITKELKDSFIEDYDLSIPHDWFLNLLASLNKGCAFLNESLVLYRIHNKNLIGANIGFLNGIKSKTREVRIKDYQDRMTAIFLLKKKYKDTETFELNDVLKLYEKMIDFYEKPNPIKLIKLYFTKYYNELAKGKVRLWEIIVAFRIDSLLLKMINVQNDNSGSMIL